MTAATKTSAERLGILEDLYIWDDDSLVRQLLVEHSGAHEPLIQAARLIPRYFGPVTRLSLSVERDQDGNEPPRLAAIIHTVQSVPEALANLDRFDEEWWLGSMTNIHHHLSFGLRFE